MRKITRRGYDEVRSGMTGFIEKGIDAFLPGEDADEGFEEPYLDWTDLSEEMSATELIDSMRSVPFRVYIVKYILEKHGEKGEDPARAAELAWQDFPANGCVPKMKKKVPGMLFPYSGRWMTREELEEILAADRAKSTDLIHLAFGLGMSFGVLNDFLRKVCRRAGLNLWNERELFTYIVFRFTGAENAAVRQQAFLAIADAYKKENTKEKKTLSESSATESIRTYTDRMMTAAQGGEESIRAWLVHPEEEAPEALRALLREYRRTQNAKGDHVRTATRKAFELWKSFREVAEEDIESFAEGGAMEKEAVLEKKRLEAPYEDEDDPYGEQDGAEDFDADDGDGSDRTAKKKTSGKAGRESAGESGASSGKTASGSVQIRYLPGQTFVLPKGVKIRYKEHDFIFRENENSDYILPGDQETTLKIAVRCERETEAGDAAVTKAAVFNSADMRFQGIHPSSSFKPKKAGKKTYLEGNLELPAFYGTFVAEGSIFLQEETGDAYRTVRAADCPAELTAVSDSEVTKDELKKGVFLTADGEEWASPIEISVGNKKIGFGKFERETARIEKSADPEAEESGEQGITVKYLYYSHAKEELSGDMMLDPEHVRLLRERIFRPETKLSASRIYALEKRRRIEVTREDILTLVFLNFAAQRQFEDIGEAAYDATARQWLGAFIATADRILGECGFYGIYRADPYDAMLCYLAASTDEPLNAFRNLWGMILHE